MTDESVTATAAKRGRHRRTRPDTAWVPIVAVLIWCVLLVGAVLIFGWDS